MLVLQFARSPDQYKVAERYSVVVKGSGGGGLGDAIRAVLAGIAYSKASQRMLHVDWSHSLLAEPGVNAFNQLFELLDVSSTSALPRGDSIRPRAWKDRLHLSLDQIYRQDGSPPWNRSDAIRTYSFDFSRLDYPEHVLVMWEFDQIFKLNLTFSGQVSTGSGLALESRILRNHLMPTPAISEKVESEWNRFGGAPMIGVHARSSSEFSKNKGLITVEQYLRAIDTALSRQPQASIFVASDNALCIEKIREKYPRIFVRKKWLATPGQSLHLNADCPDKLQATIDGLIEMLLLGRCDQIICPALSSFSRISRLVGEFKSEDEILLLPRRSVLERITSRMKRAGHKD